MSEHHPARVIHTHEDAWLAHPQTQTALAGMRWRGSCTPRRRIRPQGACILRHEPSAWGHPPIKDWEQYLKSLARYTRGLENSTGRFGGEETLRCQGCGRWVETVRTQFCRYSGEPLCLSCAASEEADA